MVPTMSFTVNSKPIFWIRLSLYAFLCEQLVRRLDQGLGIECEQIDPRQLLSQSSDSFTSKNIDMLLGTFEKMAQSGL